MSGPAGAGWTHDDAMARLQNRAVVVAAAMRYLGPEREQDAEQLAEIMSDAIDYICAAAAVQFAPTGLPEAIVQALGSQVQRHAELIAHAAVRQLTEVYLRTLRVAARK